MVAFWLQINNILFDSNARQEISVSTAAAQLMI